MRKLSRVSFFCTALLGAAFLLCSANASAKSAYGEGYDDGYDDAMEDCYDNCDCPPKNGRLTIYNGLYLGAEGGYENYRVITRGMEFANYTYNHSAAGWVGNVFAGYGRTFPSKLYLGGEAFVGGSSAGGISSVSIGGADAKTDYSAGTSFGFTFKPGYQLSTSSLLHLNLGYERTEFTNKESLSSPFLSAGVSTTQWANGLKYGLGMETAICKNTSIRLDFNHINYASYTDSTTGAKISPSDNQGVLGFAFRPTF